MKTTLGERIDHTQVHVTHSSLSRPSLSGHGEVYTLYIPQSRWRAVTKRAFDVAISSLMLLFVFPLMILFALLVKWDSEGPVFYRQLRVGMNVRKTGRRAKLRRARPVIIEGRRHVDDRRAQNVYGRPFEVIKFRTMRSDAEKDGRAVWCTPGDPRVTRVGNFLRKTHLDELPQLINILKGDMSIVGPRPERPEFVQSLSQTIPLYHQRLVLKPGLTGLAQIRHRADVIIDDVKKKIRYDLLYMKRASLSTDVKIILGTVPLVLGFSLLKWKGFKKARRFLTPGRVVPLSHKKASN